jgi:hypothetical protein
MKKEKFEVKFVDVKSLKEICLINGETLPSTEIERDFYDATRLIIIDIVRDDGGSIEDLAKRVKEENITPITKAKRAFLFGFMLACVSPDIKMEFMSHLVQLSTLKGLTKYSEVCVELHKLAKETSGELGDYMAIVMYGLLSAIATEFKN